MNRQKKILSTLLGLLSLSMLYSYWMMPEQRRVSTDVRPPPAMNTGKTQVQTAKNRLRTDLLEMEPAHYSGAKRDIFNFAAPPTKKPVALPTPAPVIKKPVQTAPPPIVNQVVRQQLARFTFLGFLVKDAVHTVFLSRGDEMFLVQEGDQFGDERQFTAISISPEKMSISQSGDSRTIDIQLVEKEPLMPSFEQSDDLQPARPTAAKTPPPTSVKTPPPTVQNRWPKSQTPGMKR